jgi:DNA (cytosine-5)-methyltransferase 1
MTLTVGSLFSGIGGLDLGLERAGMRVIWQSEIDPYASRVLAKHWPDVPNLGDVTQIDWSEVERPDLICGGYPCQPFSLAGTRQGEADARHLWPYFADALRHLRPRWALLENVPGHVSLGFDRVLADLASLGFDAEWDCVPAALVGAPHLRYRLFVIAHANGKRLEGAEPVGVGQRVGSVGGDVRPPIPDAAGSGRVGAGEHLAGGSREAVTPRRPEWDEASELGVTGEGRDDPDTERDQLRDQPVAERGGSGTSVAGDDGPHGAVADPHGERLPQWGIEQSQGGEAAGQLADSESERRRGCIEPRPDLVDDRPQPPHRDAGVGRDGGWWSVEPDVGRVAHGVPNRVDRLRCLGNAVVPQVAEHVGRLIVAAEDRVAA